MEESNDALELKNKIDKIDPKVHNGSTLIYDLMEALKIHCIEKNLEIKIAIPFDKRRSSSIYQKYWGIFKCLKISLILLQHLLLKTAL